MKLCVRTGGIICSLLYSNSSLTIFLASCSPTAGFKMHVCINRTVTDTLHKLFSITTSRMRFFFLCRVLVQVCAWFIYNPLNGSVLNLAPKTLHSILPLSYLHRCCLPESAVLLLLCRWGQQGHIRSGAAGEKVGFKAI